MTFYWRCVRTPSWPFRSTTKPWLPSRRAQATRKNPHALLSRPTVARCVRSLGASDWSEWQQLLSAALLWNPWGRAGLGESDTVWMLVTLCGC